MNVFALSISHGRDLSRTLRVPTGFTVYRWGFRNELTLNPEFLYRYFFNEPFTPESLLQTLYDEPLVSLAFGVSHAGDVIQDASFSYAQDDPTWTLGLYLQSPRHSLPRLTTDELKAFPYTFRHSLAPAQVRKAQINQELARGGWLILPPKEIDLRTLFTQLRAYVGATAHVSVVLWTCRSSVSGVSTFRTTPARSVYETVYKRRYKNTFAVVVGPCESLTSDRKIRAALQTCFTDVTPCVAGGTLCYILDKKTRDVASLLLVVPQVARDGEALFLVYNVCTQPKYRKRGLVQLLLLTAFQNMLFGAGLKRIYVALVPDARDRERLTRLYGHYGFRPMKDYTCTTPFETQVLAPTYWEMMFPADSHWLLATF